MKKLLLILVTAAFAGSFTNAQVTNTSYQARSGEKVLQFVMIVPVDKKAAWELFTKDEQLVRWIAPLAHIELRAGGFLLSNYDKNKSLSDSSSIRLDIVNYLDEELLTLKVNLNDNFSAKVQAEDQHLQQILRFEALPGNKTKITSSMVGWGQGGDWDKTYDFFAMGNQWTFEQMLKLFP